MIDWIILLFITFLVIISLNHAINVKRKIYMIFILNKKIDFLAKSLFLILAIVIKSDIFIINNR